MYELNSGSMRLTMDLYNIRNEAELESVARLLNYLERQLYEDIIALYDYISIKNAEEDAKRRFLNNQFSEENGSF